MAKKDFDDYEGADYLIGFKDTTDCNISEVFGLIMPQNGNTRNN